MTHDSKSDDNEALITYHRNQFSKDPAYLEIADSSVLEGLDNIIRACHARPPWMLPDYD
jgi:hypothetical protein